MKHILFISSDLMSRSFLHDILKNTCYQIHMVDDWRSAANTLENKVIDLILFEADQLHTCSFQEIKKQYQTIPFIVISSINHASQCRISLEYGADDFLMKPFNKNELIMRHQALLRRISGDSSENNAALAKNQKVSFDELDRAITIEDQTLTLTQTEFKLFHYLFKKRGEVVTKQELQRSVLKKELGRYDRNLDMHISNTRRKLEQIKLPRSLINTVRGQGYVLSLQ